MHDTSLSEGIISITRYWYLVPRRVFPRNLVETSQALGWLSWGLFATGMHYYY